MKMGCIAFKKVPEKRFRFVAIACSPEKGMFDFPAYHPDVKNGIGMFHSFEIDRYHIASFRKYKIGRG
jgi:hypothetical protein